MADSSPKNTTTLQIGVNDFNQLQKAKIFSKLPLSVIDYFHQEEVVIEGTSTVLKHASKNEWFLVDKKTSFWQFFYLSVGKRSKNDFPLYIHRETPDYNDASADPRIRPILTFKEEEEIDPNEFSEQGISTKKQRQKADYFFRTANSRSTFKHERTSYKLADWGDVYYKSLTYSIAKVGVFVLLSLFLCLQMWWIISFPIIGYAAYYFKNIFIEFWNLYQCNRLINQSLDTLERERQLLLSEGELSLVSDKQMQTWLSEEIKALDQAALTTFQLRKESVIPSDKSLKNRPTVGLNVEEWGLIQPLIIPGKTDVPSKHLRAFRFHGKTPLFGVYYINLFYLTANSICIFTCFYDFIQSKKLGLRTKKYAYQDLLSIGSKIENTKIVAELSPLETQQIALTFPAKEQLEIALSDHLAITNLRTKIEGKIPKGTADKEIANFYTPTNILELKKLFTLPDKQLAGTRNSLLLTSIHYFWSQQKKYPIATPKAMAKEQTPAPPNPQSSPPPPPIADVPPPPKTNNDRFRYV